MSTVFSILIGSVGFLMVFVIGAFFLVSIRLFVISHWHSCKHCGHNMIYRGLKEDNEKGYYLFHCPKCGAWEQIPREEFFRLCDSPEENI